MTGELDLDRGGPEREACTSRPRSSDGAAEPLAAIARSAGQVLSFTVVGRVPIASVS